jgi:hypothetical protein
MSVTATTLERLLKQIDTARANGDGALRARRGIVARSKARLRTVGESVQSDGSTAAYEDQVVGERKVVGGKIAGMVS